MNELGNIPLRDLIQRFYQAKNSSKDLYLFFSGKTFEEMIPVENILISIYSVLAITGFIANLTVIFIILCSKSLRNMPYNILLLNLLVSNILMAMFCIPSTLIGLLERNWILGWFLCKTIPGIQGISVCVCATTITVIAFDRYKRIKRKYNVSNGSEERRYLSVIIETLIIWIVGIFLGTPGAYFVTLESIRVNYSADQLTRDLNDTILSDAILEKILPSGVTLSDFLSYGIGGATDQKLGHFLENHTYGENFETTHAQISELKPIPPNLATTPTLTPSFQSHRTMENWEPFPEFGFTTFHRCTEVWPPYVRPVYSCSIFILQCILPAISLVVTSSLIAKHLNASRTNLDSNLDIDNQENFHARNNQENLHARNNQESLHARNIQRNKSVTRTLLCVSISFTLCWLPIHILNLLLDLEILKSPPIRPDTLYLYIALALAIAMVSVPLNALLYGWFNPSINREVVAWKQRNNLIKMFGAFFSGGATAMAGSGTVDESPSREATLKEKEKEKKEKEKKSRSCADFTITLNDDCFNSSSTNYLDCQKMNHNFNHQNLKSVSDYFLASGRSSVPASPISPLFKKCCEKDANLRDADQNGSAPFGSKREPKETPILEFDPKERLSTSKHKNIKGHSPKRRSPHHQIHRKGGKLASSSGGGKIISHSKELIGTIIVHEQTSSV